MLFSSGRMLSSHTALCTALTASVALCHGVSDALFPVCLGFTLIVMYDGAGIGGGEGGGDRKQKKRERERGRRKL